MISFDSGPFRFQLRAAAVLLQRDKVLLHRANDDTFWSLPGGRVEPGEEAAVTVMREMLEELGVTVAIERLVWMVENFFHYAGKQQHEVGFYFVVSAAKGSAVLNETGDFPGVEKTPRLTFRWFSRSELAQYDIRPAFLAKALAQDPLQFAHVVNHDA
ncbi:NUDIX hydrolase [Paraburkholderia sp.]|jgi:8-oxo-dGTP pyrophosphatase MutT (NUDIX family)|uniref:NUDIX hydrolase n=1 Tax=Paraburkholderia sp. TaxID=1926495 RepID=UPI002F3EF98F